MNVESDVAAVDPLGAPRMDARTYPNRCTAGPGFDVERALNLERAAQTVDGVGKRRKEGIALRVEHHPGLPGNRLRLEIA